MPLSNSDKQKNAIPIQQEEAKRDAAIQKEMLLRLKKIEGQVRGVHKMIQENRQCGEIVTQLAAIKSAVNRVSINVLACHLSDQIKKDLMEERDLSDSLDDFMKTFKKFS
ncbi:MAG: metal-sensitive transcriptional regulator [Peptococcaceae bacterium]|nr:metal-sensitive transcriptional regulator [Peptococcaceae bacterium]